MKIAIEGCCHGELDKIYETLEFTEKKNNIKIDLLLICGDFQAVRNMTDLKCMAVSQKYQKLNTFYKYYSGEKVAPYLTVFIGGNHEASNFLQELPYGGWVAPNIYYMGYAGVIQFGGIRIGGLSGIFKGKDLNKGHFERAPYNDETKRSVYHVRNMEFFRLKQITRPVDIFISHDWPRGIYNYGNLNMLLKRKPFFREEVEQDRLGSPVAKDLLLKLKPKYWFAAHLHVKFPAVIQHQTEDGSEKLTKFLALDKCLPRRKFLQIIDVPSVPDKPMKIELDPEWLAILKSTNHLINLTKVNKYMPGPGSSERWDFTVSVEEINRIMEDFGGDLSLPENFERTAPVYDPKESAKKASIAKLVINPQTKLLCTMLDLTDPTAVFLGKDSRINPDVLSAMEHGNIEDTDEVDEDDNVDDSDTEYESEPSFMSVSGSESFMSSNAEDSFSSFNNPNISREDPDVSFNPDTSFNPNEISISDEDEEFNKIMAAQKEAQRSDSSDEKLASPLKNFNIDSETSDNASLRSSEDEKSSPMKSPMSTNEKSSPSKGSLSQSDIDDGDPELLELMAAQKKYKSTMSQKGHLELALPSDDDSDSVACKKNPGQSVTTELNTSADMISSDKINSEKNSQKRVEDSDCEESPQTKRLKRRNQQLYTDNDS